MDIIAEINALKVEIAGLKSRLTIEDGGVPPAVHAVNHATGGDDVLTPADIGAVEGPASSTDRAIATWNGTGGDALRDNTPTIQSDGRIASVTDPTSDQDAATKKYVDDNIGGGAHASSHENGGGDEVNVGGLSGVLADPQLVDVDAAGALDGDSASTPLAVKVDGTTIQINGSNELEVVGGGGGGSVGDLLDWQFVRKAADESVTSSTTLQADDELLFPIGANETWEFEFVLNHIGAEAGDFKVSVSGPTGCAGQWSPIGPHESSTGSSRIFNARAFTTWDQSENHGFGNISTVRTSSIIKGLARNGANAGNIALNWAQGTSNGTATQVLTDSYVIARRVA